MKLGDVDISEIKVLLFFPLTKKKLLIMTPSALLAIHPEAAEDLRAYTLPRITQLSDDIQDSHKLEVIFHPAATLSALAVDWSSPDRAFAFITPKFQRTAKIYDRVNILLDSEHIDTASIARMFYEARKKSSKAYGMSLDEAPAMLNKLLTEIDL